MKDPTAAEFEQLLEDASYELTGARAAGPADTDRARAALRRARDKLDAADSLVAAINAERAAGS